MPKSVAYGLLWIVSIMLLLLHSITQQYGPSKYDNEILLVHFEFESPQGCLSILLLYFEGPEIKSCTPSDVVCCRV